jgi:hypothetical protein
MSDYRYREIEDLMIRAYIARVGVGLSETENSLGGIGDFFPNPASDKAYLKVDASLIKSDNLLVQLYDAKGSLLRSEQLMMQSGQLEVNLQGLSAGLYTVRLIADGQATTRKVAVGN